MQIPVGQQVFAVGRPLPNLTNRDTEDREEEAASEAIVPHGRVGHNVGADAVELAEGDAEEDRDHGDRVLKAWAVVGRLRVVVDDREREGHQDAGHCVV